MPTTAMMPTATIVQTNTKKVCQSLNSEIDRLKHINTLHHLLVPKAKMSIGRNNQVTMNGYYLFFLFNHNKAPLMERKPGVSPKTT